MIHNSYIWLKINVVFYIKSIIWVAFIHNTHKGDIKT